MPQPHVRRCKNELATEIICKHHDALVLIEVIGDRMRFKDSPVKDGIKIGQALIGDYANYNLTEQRYRTAKKFLVENGVITTQATNRGTIATIVNGVFFIISESNEQRAEQRTDNGRITDRERLTNKEYKEKECLKEKTICRTKPKALPTECYEIADRLIEFVQSCENRHINGQVRRQWADTVDKMQRIDKLPLDRISEAVTYHVEHHEDEYWPVIMSATALRSKFSNLERAIKRGKDSYWGLVK